MKRQKPRSSRGRGQGTARVASSPAGRAAAPTPATLHRLPETRLPGHPLLADLHCSTNAGQGFALDINVIKQYAASISLQLKPNESVFSTAEMQKQNGEWYAFFMAGPNESLAGVAVYDNLDNPRSKIFHLRFVALDPNNIPTQKNLDRFNKFIQVVAPPGNGITSIFNDKPQFVGDITTDSYARPFNITPEAARPEQTTSPSARP